MPGSRPDECGSLLLLFLADEDFMCAQEETRTPALGWEAEGVMVISCGLEFARREMYFRAEESSSVAKR